MTTHVGHYFIKALEEWKTAAKINTRPGHETEVGDSIRILELLGEEAAHWVLSTSALQFIWNTDIAKTDLTDMRMPFPTMIVEYLFDYGALGYDTNKIAPERDLAAERFFIFHENNDTEEDSIFMLAGFRLQADKDYNIPVRWVFSPVALTMTYQSLYQLNDWVKKEDLTSYSIRQFVKSYLPYRFTERPKTTCPPKTCVRLQRIYSMNSRL